MNFDIEIKHEASIEIIEAYIYYEKKQFDLGEKFIEELDDFFSPNTRRA